MNRLDLLTERVYRVFFNNTKKEMTKNELYKVMEGFLSGCFSGISIDLPINGYLRELQISSSAGVFLITGYDCFENKSYGIRQDLSLFNGDYLIGGNFWSGVFLTNNLSHVKKAFLSFIEEGIFDEDVMVEE